jgi:hypothetical protein
MVLRVLYRFGHALSGSDKPKSHFYYLHGVIISASSGHQNSIEMLQEQKKGRLV